MSREEAECCMSRLTDDEETEGGERADEKEADELTRSS